MHRVNKFDDIGSWRLFGQICWLLEYPCEYWDYFSNKNTTKYNYEDNLKHYVNVYKQNRNRWEYVILKNENNNKLNKLEQRLVNKYYSAKNI